MNRVWIRRLSPSRLNGFSKGDIGLDDLGPGLNIVCAPNATGKSTLGLAIGYLFDPKKCAASMSIEAEIVDGNETSDRTVRGKDSAYSTFFGPPETYRLELPTLLDGLNKAQMGLIEELLGSGISLKAPTIEKGVAEKRSAVEARKPFREARRLKEKVLQIEENLPELQRMVEESKSAESQLKLLHSISDAKALRSSLDALEEEINLILDRHPGVERQTQGAVDLCSQMLRKLQASTDAADKANSAFGRFGQEHPKKPLDSVTQAELSNLKRQLEELAAANNKIVESIRAQESLADAARELVLNFQPDEPEDRQPLPTIEDLQALKQAAGEEEKVLQARVEIGAFKDALKRWDGEQQDPPADADERIRRLIGWLESEAPQQVASRPWPTIFLVIATAVAAALPIDIVFRASAAILLAAAAVAFAIRTPSPAGKRWDRSESGIEPDWVEGNLTTGNVSKSLVRLLHSKSAEQIAERLAALADRPEPVSSWQEVSENLRLRCKDPLAVSLLATNIADYANARARLKELRIQLEASEADQGLTRSKTKAILDDLGWKLEPGTECLAASDVEPWLQASSALTSALKSEAADRSTLIEKLTELGIDGEGDLEIRIGELKARSSAVDRFVKIQEKKREIERDLVRHTIDPAAIEALFETSDLASVTDAEIEELKTFCQETASQLSERQTSFDEARSEIKNAEREQSISFHEAGFRASQAKLEAKWRQSCASIVEGKLKQAIKEEIRSDSLPDVLRRASEHLSRFSSNRYRLLSADESDKDLGSLVLLDNTREGEYRFSQLSTGTKIHVVVALRLAMIEQHEKQGSAFPLIADETMAVSDAEASKALAKTLATIAERRQVFVFTNQEDDVRILKSVSRSAKVMGVRPAKKPDIPPEPKTEEQPSGFAAVLFE